MGPRAYGLDRETVNRIAGDMSAVHGMGVELCVVIGGGNIFRGVSGAAGEIERASADYMGRLATVINAIAIQSALERLDLPPRVLSDVRIASACTTRPYRKRRPR